MMLQDYVGSIKGCLMERKYYPIKRSLKVVSNALQSRRQNTDFTLPHRCLVHVYIDIARERPLPRGPLIVERPLSWSASSPFGERFSPKAWSARRQVTARGLLCVNPAKASAFRMFNISAPCTLSRRSGSFVASAGAPLAGAKGYTLDVSSAE